MVSTFVWACGGASNATPRLLLHNSLMTLDAMREEQSDEAVSELLAA
jgi:hypothetical protein